MPLTCTPQTIIVELALGRVNLFHGRAHQGQFGLGSVAMEAPEHAHVQDAPAVGYVRPHDLEVLRHRNGTSFEAVVRHIHPVGAVVRLELERHDDGAYLEAELTRDQFRDLGLTSGEHVHVKPRKLQVFVGDDLDFSI